MVLADDLPAVLASLKSGEPGDLDSMSEIARAFVEGRAEALGGLPIDAVDAVAVCPCGTPEPSGAQGRRFCTCPLGAERRRAFERSITAEHAACEVPDRLASATLARCREAVRDAATDPERQMRHEATAAAERFETAIREGRRPGAGLCLTGSVGTGKSFTLAALTHAIRRRGIPVAWTTYASLVAAVRRHYGTPIAESVEANLQRCPVLVIDDLGDPFRTRGDVQETEDKRRILLGVIAERSARLLPTLISANYGSLGDMAEQLDPRIADRIRESCELHMLVGASLRRAPSI